MSSIHRSKRETLADDDDSSSDKELQLRDSPPSSSASVAVASATAGAGGGISKQSTRNNIATNTTAAEELITELLSITPTNELEESQRFVTVAEERAVRNRQLGIVTELLEIVQCARSESISSSTAYNNDAILHEEEEDDDGRRESGDSTSFIRTNISEYGYGSQKQQQQEQQAQLLHLREALGGCKLPSSTTSSLAASLTRLISHRVELESLLPGTQDTAANLEAMGLSSSMSQILANDSGGDDDNGQGAVVVNDMQLRSGQSTKQLHEERRKSSAKAALTISTLGLTSAQLYVELLGTKGAWGGGMIDVGGISAISALVRRWCVECRGREDVLGRSKAKQKKEKKKGGNKPPATKRSKLNSKKIAKALGSRKSVRISEVVSVMNNEDGGMSGNDEDDAAAEEESNNMNATFQVEEQEDDPTASMELTEVAMITGGLRLAQSLGRVPLQVDYKNWSAEAREFFLDGASAGLGIASALLGGCKGMDEENAAICQEAVTSLEYALRMSVMTKTTGTPDAANTSAAPMKRGGRSRRSRRSSAAASKEDAAAKKRLQESGIYLLRGLLPMFNLKMELPNGQAGKLAAYETVSNLVVNIITSITEDIELNSRSSHQASSKSPRELLDESITPKRGGRKSIAFSHTPAPLLATSTKKNRRESLGPTPKLAPPSLKKSITPRRTRNSNASFSFSDRPVLHPVLSLIVGMLHKLFTTKGLERAETRSRVCSFGIICLEQLPTLERSNLLRFVGDLTESKISSHRLLGVELLGVILCQGWFWKDHEKTSQSAHWMYTPFSSFGEKASENSASGGSGERPSSSGSATLNTPSSILLAALQGRLTDKSPTVRTRAAMSLSEVVKKASTAKQEGTNLDGTVIASTPSKLMGESNIASGALTVALCKIGTSLVEELRHRASTDDRATVRKSCIVAWLQMLNLAHRENKEEFVVSGLDISALCQLCNDTSVATRKAAADALTKLVQANYASEEYTPQASSLEMAWSLTVLPLVTDAETTCVMKAVEFFSELVIEPIVELGRDTAEKLNDDDDNMRYFVAWRILAKLSDGSKDAGGSRNASGSLITALQKLLINAGKDSKALAKNLFRAVYHVSSISLGLDRRSSLDSTMSHDGELEDDLFDLNTTAMRTGSWCLLDALTSCLATTTNGNSQAVSLGQAVKASHIDSSFLALSLQKLRSLISSGDVPSDKKNSLVGTSRDCMTVIAKMASFVPLDDAEACFSALLHDLEGSNVSIALISATVNALIALTKRMCDESGKDVFDEVRFWADELLHRCENAIESCFASFGERGRINQDDEKLLSAILYLVGELVLVGFSSQEDSSLLSSKKQKDDVAPTDREPVRGLLICPPARLVHFVKLMLPNQMPLLSGAHELAPTPTGTRALAFITLGKFCLRDESLAKESLSKFVCIVQCSGINSMISFTRWAVSDGSDWIFSTT